MGLFRIWTTYPDAGLQFNTGCQQGETEATLRPPALGGAHKVGGSMVDGLVGNLSLDLL